MPAVKSGNDIHVSGSGNTVTSIVSDINDVAFISAPSPGVAEINCTTTVRELKILSGGTLTVGDNKNMSLSETLQWNSGANSRSEFRVDSGGQFNVYGASVVDFCMSSSYYSYYIYIYGGLTISGNVTYKPIIKNMRWIGFRTEGSTNNPVSVTDCIMGSSSYPSTWDAFCFKFDGNQAYARTSMVFERIEFDQTYGHNKNTTAINFEFMTRGMQNIIFDTCDFDNIYRALDGECGVSNLKNCTFNNISNYAVICTRAAPNYGDQSYGSYDNAPETLLGQTFNVCDGNTFENLGSNLKLYSYYSARLMVRNTHIKELSANSIYAVWGGIILWWTGNTVDNTTTPLEIYNNGAINFVNGFKWTVEDELGNPLEGVSIRIVQSENKERFLFETGADGKPYDVLGEGAVLLTHTQQRGGSHLTDTSQQLAWSDTGNSTYHTVEFSRPGYKTVTQTYAVKQAGETTETITLRRERAHALTF